MTTRTASQRLADKRRQIARRKETALDAFIARKAEIDEMLTRLQALSEDHFNTCPDDIDWGHAGTLAHYAEQLRRVTDAAFHEGEHAA